MKQVNILISILLSIILILPPMQAFATSDITAEMENSTVEEKIYCDATIDQEFADDTILIVLDRDIGAINKVHDKTFFGGVKVKNIVDLTAIPSYDTAKNSKDIVSQIDENNFHQIIKLELEVNSKEYVLQAIAELEKIDGIMYAGPDYIHAAPAATTANDVLIDSQWAVQKIELDEAWDISTGSARVRVGVIDSGIASHPDLNANLSEGWDFYNENSVTTDDVSWQSDDNRSKRSQWCDHQCCCHFFRSETRQTKAQFIISAM